MRVLMCDPQYFEIRWTDPELNPHMDTARQPNRALALKQWMELRAFYESLGVKVYLLEPQEHLSDQVFTANVAWGMGSAFVMANFAPEGRKPEVKYAARWFVDHRFSVQFLPEQFRFEGQADIVNVGNALLYCWGIRNNRESIEEIQRIFRIEKPIVPLRLVNKDFYHGDVCIRYLKHNHSLLYNPIAFDRESMRAIENLDVHKIVAPPELWIQETPQGRNFPLNGCYIGNVITFPWDKGVADFPQKIRQQVEQGGGRLWLHNFDQFGLSGAGHRCVTLFLD